MPTLGEFTVNEANTVRDEGSRVIALADGGYAIVWNGGYRYPNLVTAEVMSAVRARIYNADGTARTGELVIDQGSLHIGTAMISHVQGLIGTQMADGNIALMWASSESSDGTGYYDLRAAVISASGASVVSEFEVNTGTDGLQYPGALVALSGGGFMAVWSSLDDMNVPETSGDIRARLFAADGTPAGAEFTVNATLAGSQTDPAATVLANGDVVIAWVDRASDNYSPDFTIRAQRYDAAGVPLGGEVALTQPTGTNESAFFPSITALAGGGYIITWKFGVGDDELRGQIFDAAGQAVGGVRTLIAGDVSNMFSTTNIAALPGGGFAVFYTDFNPGPAATTTDPVMQLFNADGEPVGGMIQLAASMLGAQDFNHGAVLANGDIVTTWSHVGGTPGEIRARMLSVPALSSTLGSGDVVQAAIDENISAVTTFSATDSSGAALVYAISGGADAAKFQLDPVTHALRFIAAPDADVPGDAGGNNVYDVVVQVSNGLTADTQRLAITVGNLIDGATITGNATGDVISFYQTTRGLARPTNSEDVIYGMDGADTINGQGGDDTIHGGNGADRLYGSEGDDSLTGGEGNDWLDGGEGQDILAGGGGSDRYYVDLTGEQVIEAAGGGTDIVWSLVDYVLPDNVENLTLYGLDLMGTGNGLNNVITGSAGNDTLVGGDGKDSLNGGEGADSILGGNGSDSLIGGLGNDTLEGGAGNDIYTIDSVDDIVSEAVGGGTDLLKSDLVDLALAFQVENATLLGGLDLDLLGNGLANVLHGNGGSNLIQGDAGNDFLRGNDGNDTLVGGSGGDNLTGGTGTDTFRFDVRGSSASRDVVVDFASGTDRIEISRTAFSAFSGDPAGLLGAGKLVYGTVAASAGDHLIYDTATGRLLYDGDGLGGAAAIEIARFTGNPSLLVSDIWLI